MFKHVLILCHANICRSPIAEILWRKRFPGHEVKSAGIAAQKNLPPAAEMIELAQERGLDLTLCRSQPLTPELLQWADLILVMDDEQKRHLECSFPHVCGKVHLLGKWSKSPVLDPYRKSLADYEECFANIEKHIEDWWKRVGSIS